MLLYCYLKSLGGDVMSESSSAAVQVGALINKGKFQMAKKLSKKLLEENRSLKDSAVFLFQVILAERLTGDKQGLADELWESSKTCRDYTREMEGDLYRDLALAAIRAGNIDQAESALGKARAIHEDNVNRMAAITMVEGRIAYSKRDYYLAATLHGRAAFAWHKIGELADEQWVKNNTFHQLRAIVVSRRFDHTFQQQLYNQVLRYDESRNHHIGAWLAFRLGRFGNVIYDKLAKFLG
ncbi:MAG TPA: hypothetical protein PLZ58_03455 [Candidatus Saccharibacteria bacterium]|nr:hypothetical protein [Candidatus Saccharibacteria bacterium]HRQ06870.1 hypothetical protein [Candidatus Saccharibacteria bacterium]